mmetsp:Transcript_49194/g.84116  ORF Transcript_49194/g.84116 Transcript_49194/m.84116 type:complete len:236 (-) Transcript_49194:258-965(-)
MSSVPYGFFISSSSSPKRGKSRNLSQLLLQRDLGRGLECGVGGHGLGGLGSGPGYVLGILEIRCLLSNHSPYFRRLVHARAKRLAAVGAGAGAVAGIAAVVAAHVIKTQVVNIKLHRSSRKVALPSAAEVLSLLGAPLFLVVLVAGPFSFSRQVPLVFHSCAAAGPRKAREGCEDQGEHAGNDSPKRGRVGAFAAATTAATAATAAVANRSRRPSTTARASGRGCRGRYDRRRSG